MSPARSCKSSCAACWRVLGDAREAMATMGLLCAFALLATPPSSSREVAESKLVEYFNGTLSVPKLSSVAVSKAKIEIDRQTQYMHMYMSCLGCEGPSIAAPCSLRAV